MTRGVAQWETNTNVRVTTRPTMIILFSVSYALSTSVLLVRIAHGHGHTLAHLVDISTPSMLLSPQFYNIKTGKPVDNRYVHIVLVMYCGNSRSLSLKLQSRFNGILAGMIVPYLQLGSGVLMIDDRLVLMPHFIFSFVSVYIYWLSLAQDWNHCEHIRS